MTALKDWFISLGDHISDVRDVRVAIGRAIYDGVSYRDANFANEPRLYLLGDLPAAYKRSTHTAFVIAGADWYVACYMPAERITPEFAPFHPFGPHFMLCRWQVPSGEAIDAYEPRPYTRVLVQTDWLHFLAHNSAA